MVVEVHSVLAMRNGKGTVSKFSSCSNYGLWFVVCYIITLYRYAEGVSYVLHTYISSP